MICSLLVLQQRCCILYWSHVGCTSNLASLLWYIYIYIYINYEVFSVVSLYVQLKPVWLLRYWAHNIVTHDIVHGVKFLIIFVSINGCIIDDSSLLGCHTLSANIVRHFEHWKCLYFYDKAIEEFLPSNEGAMIHRNIADCLPVDTV